MKHKKQLLIFDWDGTLMDSQARIVACFERSIDDLQAEPRSYEQISNIIGLGIQEALDSLFPGQDAAFYQDFTEAYRRHFLGEDMPASHFFDGARWMLEDLNKQDYFLAIATGKGRRGLDKVLRETDSGHLFHASRCADETRSKPHPLMLEELLDFFAVDSEQALMIGDTEYDLQMAANAGMQALGVCYGVHERQRLLDCAPLACLEDVKALHCWLNERIEYSQY